MARQGWTHASAVAAAAFVVLAVLQLVLPVQAMFEPRPARFGWQMYSTMSHMPEAWVEDADGALHPVDVARYMADPRAEIFVARPLAMELCTASDARAVVVDERGERERIPCS